MNLRAFADRILSQARSLALRLQGIQVGPRCRISAGVRLRRSYRGLSRGSIVLGERCDLRDGAMVETWGGNVVLGRNVFIGPQVVIYGHGGVSIGDDTLVAMHCRIVSSNHAMPPLGVDIRSQPDELLPTRIGRDVWLGAGVTVLGGVTIADGCIVGAGAVVTHDLAAGSIAHGVPARVMGQRQRPSCGDESS